MLVGLKIRNGFGEKDLVAEVGKALVVGRDWSSGTAGRKCEGCQLKARPSFGLPSEGKARWCAGCAKGHPGAADVVSKKCEDCGRKAPSLGLPAEGIKRWCAGCAKAHAGAVNVEARKKCEHCGVKHRHFGLPAEGKARWCSGCAKAHTGAVDVKHKKCEGCQVKTPNFALPTDGKKRRWCQDCAPKAARGWRRTQARGSVLKKPNATDPPLTISGP
jgi:hypothetical protein